MTLSWDIEGHFPTAYTAGANTKGLYHLEANANDSSGNGKNGTATNIAYAAARIGNGAHYTTGDGGISIPANTWGALGTGDFAVACWFYGAAPGAGNRPDIFISKDTDSPYYGVRIIFDPLGVAKTGDGILFTCSTEADGTKVTSPTASSMYGKWTHIVFTRVSGTCYVYYNGMQVSSFADTTDLPAPDAMAINGIAATAIEAWKDGLVGDEYIIEDAGWTAATVNTVFGWTSVKSDCAISQPVTAKHGIQGNQPTDRIASPGTLSFTLINGPSNSGAKTGYYSPGHADCRTGFDLGTLFRLKISDGVDTVYQLRSKVKSIRPVAGKYGIRTVSVMCADYMEDISQAPLQQIPVQVNTYINLVINTVLGYMAIAPCNKSGIVSPNGPEDYDRLLFGMMDNKSSLITALQKLCQTDKSYFFIIGNTTDGETLKWQARHDRNANTVDATFSDNMIGMIVEYNSTNLFNNVTTVAHPCSVDTSTVVLARTDAKEFAVSPGASNAVEMTLKFTDPDQLGRQVDMVYGSQPGAWPAADTDYKFSSSAGGGNDMNADLSISVVWGANSAKVTFTNNGSVIGYVNLFHIRGLGIYDYDPIEKVNEDSTSQYTYNDRPLRYDMPYCDYTKQADDFGKALLGQYKEPTQNIKSVTFNAHDPNYPTFAGYAVALDVGKCASITETITGVSNPYFINSIKWECRENNTIKVSLENLEPANAHPLFRICAADDDVEDPAISILAEYSEDDTINFTATNPYGNPFHVLGY